MEEVDSREDLSREELELEIKEAILEGENAKIEYAVRNQEWVDGLVVRIGQFIDDVHENPEYYYNKFLQAKDKYHLGITQARTAAGKVKRWIAKQVS